MRSSMKLAPIRRIGLVTVCAALALAGCKKPPEKESEAERARAVRVVTVQPRAIVGALAASGDLIAREEAAVSWARITRQFCSAVRVESISVRPRW